MSRKRSREAMLALWREFRDGARERGVDDETIRTVFQKLIGFSNFGFPKAHSAAFAVLAYQSAWLRRRYPAEFLAALLNAQPMGFYPPASLVRDAQRRGVRVLTPCVHRSHGGLRRAGRGGAGGPRVRARGARGRRRAPGGRARGRRPLPRPGRPGRRAPSSAASSSPSSCAPGACDAFERPRRAMLWELGTLSPARARRRAGRQLAAPPPRRARPAAPRAEPLGAHPDRLRDHGPLRRLAPGRLVRPGLPPGTLTAAELRETPHGRRVSVAGLVVARQRPATAGRHRLPAHGGRDRHGQRDRAARGLRAPPRPGPGRAPAGGLGPPGAAGAQPQRAGPPPGAGRGPGSPALAEVGEAPRVRAAAPEAQSFGRGRR